MTLEETQGEVAAPEVEEAIVETTEETQGSDTEESVDNTETQEAEAEVEVEVDYKSLSEKLQKDVDGRQDKINKQRKALTEQNRQREELQIQLNSIQAMPDQKEPSIDDFETHDEYVNALADFRADARVKESHEKLLSDQKAKLEHDQNQKAQAEFAKQEHAYRLENTGYDAAKTELQQHIAAFPLSTDVSNAVYEQASRDGKLAEVINYFGAEGGANLVEFDRIMALSPVEAAVETYKLQQSLKTATPKKESKPVAPPAKRPKGGGKPNKDLHSGSVLKNLGLKA